ncbi:MAG: CD1375 family protein [Peptostreptococcaceae bacterium]|nr:CD1375 family protein [Peptostreptococcaceae bacterium]
MAKKKLESYKVKMYVLLIRMGMKQIEEIPTEYQSAVFEELQK